MKKILLLFLAGGLFVGCSKDDDTSIKINQSDVRLKFDEEFSFTINGADDAEWSSSDHFVGTIDNSGQFKASHIGETTITAKIGDQEFTTQVVVDPYIETVNLPYLEFGKTKADVKKFEARELVEESDLGLYFEEPNEFIRGAVYTFADDLLVSGGLLWVNDKSEECIKYYLERFHYAGEDDDFHYFVNKEETIVVALGFDQTIGLCAIYVKNNDESKANIKKLSNTSLKQLEKLVR